MSETENPKLFISYSWSSVNHEKFVLQIASELRESGVDVILDKWDLKEGHDSHKFMERMVTDKTIKKVVIISDKIYADKADDRSGGVGTEAQIISGEIYSQSEQDKFVVVVTEKDEKGRPYVPTYYKSRIHIDLSEQDTYGENFERLLRWIYDKPLYLKPEIGKEPSFLDDEERLTLGTSASFKRAVEAIKVGNANAAGNLQEYLTLFSSNLERFRINDVGNELDDIIVFNIESFLPSRNEYIQLVTTIALYGASIEWIEKVHRFFESLLNFLERIPKGKGISHQWALDNYKFIVHELFLYTIAIFLKHEKYEQAVYFLKTQYYQDCRVKYGKDPLVSYEEFRCYLASLRYRNQRLELRRLSVHADLLKERCSGHGLDFKLLMQTDFILFIYSDLHITGNRWWPEVLVYLNEWHQVVFECFARAKSRVYFDKMKCILGIDKVSELKPLLQKYKERSDLLPKWEFRTINPESLLGFKNLASVP